MRGRRSIRRTIFNIAALVGLFATVSAMATYYFIFTARFAQELALKSERVADRLAETLSQPIWNFHDANIRKIVESELADEDILGIVIRNEEDSIVYHARSLFPPLSPGLSASPMPPVVWYGQTPGYPGQEDIDRIAAAARFETVRLVFHEHVLIGKVSVYVTGAAQYRSFLERLSMEALIAILEGVLITLVSTFTVDRLVSRRVLVLVADVSRFAAKDFTARASDSRRDEIGELAATFNLMADTIERHGRDLEKIVEERTAQLVESEKLAFLGSLVAGIAHEVNTPLGVSVTAASHAKATLEAIRAGYESAAMSEEDFTARLDDSAESIDIIALNLTRAAEFIRSFKQLAADQAKEEHRSIELRAYLEEIVLSLRPKLKYTKVRVRIDCPEELSIVSVPGAVYQIVTNLIVNSLLHAFDANSEGLISIQARFELGGVRIVYRDDGKGIAPEILPRIFEPFFTTSRDRGGTGLGLYIVKSTAVKLGGDIVCASHPGAGVEFSIFIPNAA